MSEWTPCSGNQVSTQLTSPATLESGLWHPDVRVRKSSRGPRTMVVEDFLVECFLLEMQWYAKAGQDVDASDPKLLDLLVAKKATPYLYEDCGRCLWV
jgi:hypothetical protein